MPFELFTDVLLEFDAVAEPVVIDTDDEEPDAALALEPVDAVEVWCGVGLASCERARSVAVLEPDAEASRPVFTLRDADVFCMHC